MNKSPYNNSNKIFLSEESRTSEKQKMLRHEDLRRLNSSKSKDMKLDSQDDWKKAEIYYNKELEKRKNAEISLIERHKNYFQTGISIPEYPKIAVNTLTKNELYELADEEAFRTQIINKIHRRLRPPTPR